MAQAIVGRGAADKGHIRQGEVGEVGVQQIALDQGLEHGNRRADARPAAY